MADELTTSLGFEATAAIQQLTALQAELAGYNQVIASAATSTQQFNQSGKQFDKTAAGMATSMGKVSTAAAKTATSTSTMRNQIVQAEAQLRSVFGRPTKNVELLGNELEEAGKKGKESGKAVLLSWQSVVRIFAIQTIHRFITLITNAFADGLKEAQEYQTRLAEIQTIGSDLNLSLSQLDSQVRQLSEAFGQPIEQVAEGVYQTLSNQVGEATQAFEFMAAAQKFAVTAVTDAESAVNLLSSAINAYGFASTDAELVAAKLFKTIELGRIRGRELSDTYGRVLVTSAQLGVSFDEVNAAMATLTVQGLKANEAMTLITNTQLKLIRPTDALKEVFSDLGVASAEAGIQAFGFQGFLEKLTEVSGDSVSEIGELFNRVRAIRGVLGLTANEGKRFNDVLEEIESVDLSDFDEAFSKIFETDAQQFQRDLTALRNFFVADFGQGALEVLTNVAGAFGGAKSAVTTLTAAVAAATATFLIANGTMTAGIAAITGQIAAYGGLTAAIVAATKATVVFIATNPVALAVAAAAAVITAVVAYNKLTESIREAAETQKTVLASATRQTVADEQRRRRELKRSEEEILGNTQKFLAERTKAFKEANDAIIRLERAAIDSLTDQVKDRVKALESFADTLKDSIKDAVSDIRQLNGELQATGDELEQFNFDRSLRGLNESQQAFAGISRAQEFIREANDALAKGDIERAQRLQAIAESTAQAALGAADESKNRGLIARAEEQVRNTLRNRSRLQQQLIDNREREAQIASDQLAQTERLVTEIGTLGKEVEELNKILAEGEFDPKFDEQAVRARLVELGTQITAGLEQAAGQADLLAEVNLDFADIASDFRAGFRDTLVSGPPIDLTDAITVNFDRIIERARSQLEGFTPEQIGAIPGVDDDSLNFLAEAQQQVAKLPQHIQNAAKDTQALNVAQGEFNQAVLEARTQMIELDTQIGAIERRGDLGLKLFGDVEGITGGFLDGLQNIRNAIIPIKQESAGVGDALTRAATDFIAASQAGDVDAQEEAFRRVEAITNSLSQNGLPNLANRAKGVQEALKGVGTAADKILDARELAETLQPLEQSVQAIGTAFANNKVAVETTSAATEQAINKNIAAEKREQDEIQRTIDKINAKAKARASEGGGQPGLQFGGLSYRKMGGMVMDPYILRRALGGFTPRGTDSVLTALTPGESVNTVGATQQFFPQIQAMNAGITPTFREQGGTTINNNGDINLSVTEASSSRETAREVLKLINRERRRDTTSIRRFK